MSASDSIIPPQKIHIFLDSPLCTFWGSVLTIWSLWKNSSLAPSKKKKKKSSFSLPCEGLVQGEQEVPDLM